jgi:hypothetical protein
MLTPMLEQIASLARLDFSPQHRQPPASRVLLATVTAIAGSLAADAILVAIGERVFPVPGATCISGSRTTPS